MPTSLDPLNTPPSSVLTRENRIIKQAIDILERRLFASGPQVLSQVAAMYASGHPVLRN
ncbi:TPA: hypothetical protein ACRMKM_001809 [Pseudomonas aeruginosa]